MEGKISFDDVTMPFPQDMDDTEVERAIGTLTWRPFPEGVATTIEDFRAAIAAGRLDVDRAIA